VRTSASYWRQPLRWNAKAKASGKRHLVFCASIADVFEDRPELESWRVDLFELIRDTPALTWLLLTKRHENIARLMPSRSSVAGESGLWPNVWLGTTVEDQQRAEERLPRLLEVPAAVRFVSCEPLLDRVDLTAWLRPHGLGRATIDWLIIGGESGPQARRFDLALARSLVAQCREAGVAPFVKQLGARPGLHLAPPAPYSDHGLPSWTPLELSHRAGADPSEWPVDLRVQEFPARRRGGED
jgi:protein gp37